SLPVSVLGLGSLLTKNILDPAVVAAGYKEPFPGFAAGWGGGATLAQALRPFPQYGIVLDANAGAGKTWYDALQTKVERRFGSLNQILTPGNPLGNLTFAPLTKANSTGSPIRTGVSATSLDPNNDKVRWLNAAAWAVAPANTLGTASYYNGQFRNPWYRGENL